MARWSSAASAPEAARAGPKTSGHAAGGRPTRPLPLAHLIRISAYWFGLCTVWSGILQIVNGRLQFSGLVAKGSEGLGALQIALAGTVIAIVVQPTVGTISDYTITRWGRRKPYILIGSSLDLVFLWGIATSNSVAAVAVFVALLQFSSNFAQGPFQGYIPDLVPAPQVGLASGLLGLFSALGNVCGYAVAALAIALSATSGDAFFWGTMALGLIEFLTMLSVVIRVDEGPRRKTRSGRSWFSIAAEAWATDILRERSFLWLLGSRACVLVGAGFYPNLSTFYLAQVFGLDSSQTGAVQLLLLGIVAVCMILAVVPASRLSDRLGRKTIIYWSCAVGAVGLALGAVAPILPVAMIGAALFAVSAGSFVAVDWALMSDIVPKTSAGRYMGISNVATASAGTFVLAFGAAGVMDRVNALFGYGTGPRAALAFGVLCYLLGAILLRPVVERRREDEISAAAATEPPAGALASQG
jgi:Na+/melibiose symporter-like transporter